MMLIRRKNVLNLFALCAVIAFVFWICAFKIFDADFFWHVTAGRVMRQAGGLITTDPFAYTREGLPYLANHEWLAQIILSIVFDTFGSTGVILLRSLLVSTAVLLVLLIGKKNLWIYAPLAMFAALTIRGGAMDRPHLWTWVMVAVFLFMCARILQKDRMRWKDVGMLLTLQILWVNLHGGAAVLGVVITGALVAELMMKQRKIDRFAALPILLFGALLISPLDWDNVAYLRTLVTDSTTRFIAEWQPREFSLYMRDLWPFWACALGALALMRKHLAFSILILGATGFLSRTAYRHEMLFALAAAAITILQLEDERWRERLRTNAKWLLPSAIVASLAVILYASSLNRAFANRYHAHGYGIVDRTADVVSFLDREEITGSIFNTYNLGSELLYHFAGRSSAIAQNPALGPDRKVFVDGRNIDYGEEFLSQIFAAATDVSAWRALEEKHGFTIAIVDISDLKGDSFPYIIHLESDPQWRLIYIDDSVALYAKNAKGGYQFLRPQNFLSGDILHDTIHSSAIEEELRRSVAHAPGSIHARLLLARLLIAQGRVTDAQVPLAEALTIDPDEYRPYEVSGLLLARSGDFDGAEFAFDAALARLGMGEAKPIREYVVKIFEQLGEQERARRYRQ